MAHTSVHGLIGTSSTRRQGYGKGNDLSFAAIAYHLRQYAVWMRLFGSHGKTSATIAAKSGADAACGFEFAGEAAVVFVTQGGGDDFDAGTGAHQFNGVF